MSSQLEQFIRDHREEFDTDIPASKVWENINHDLDPGSKKITPVIRFGFLRWSVAAFLVLTLGAGIWYFAGSTNRKVKNSLAVKDKTASPSSSEPEKTKIIPPDKVFGNELAQKANPPVLKDSGQVLNPGSEVGMYDEEMYHYAKLVEIKHKELKKIEKDEPLLYKQFAGDVSKLDSVYHSLQEQLPKNPNREQLLEAMIQNLQLQMRLLNHQLNIIKQINHSKKSAYENAYKSI